MIDNESARALVELGRHLRSANYHFTTTTPETHRRVLARRALPARDLRDVFGWSRVFAPSILPPTIMDLLARANSLRSHPDGLSSAVRFSTLGDQLFVHSAYPTNNEDDVFFGPDTYRFCSFIARSQTGVMSQRCVDIGCGSGAGGIVAKATANHVDLVDVNDKALEFARVNAELAGVDVAVFGSDVLASVRGDVDLVIANPPYMIDNGRRTYRDGGGRYGESLSVRIVRESLDRLLRGGRLLLYTGAAIVDGCDTFMEAVAPLLERHTRFHYEEIDVDVFGEELGCAAYATVERIAAVGLHATRL